MARYKVLVIVPFPLSEKGMANRRAQLAGQVLDPEIEFEFKPVKSSGALLDSNPDFLQLDVAIYEAGIDAERDGYSAVCIDTVSDSGMNSLRSRLSIPVVGPGQAMFHLACAGQEVLDPLDVRRHSRGRSALPQIARRVRAGASMRFGTARHRRDGLGEPHDRQGGHDLSQARGRSMQGDRGGRRRRHLPGQHYDASVARPLDRAAGGACESRGAKRGVQS